MQVTSLFDLRQQLAVYLLPLLGECEILYSMPTVRRPLAAGVTTLVLNDHSVKRRTPCQAALRCCWRWACG